MPTSTTGSPPWRVLLDRALLCLDGLAARGLPTPAWTFGGGTVLMLRYAHRRSRDVDIFLQDAQALTALSPRLSSQAASLTDAYVESSSFLKLSMAEGEIDFIVAPSLLGVSGVTVEVDGRAVPADSSAEIICKKLFYRPASLRVRDVLDLAVVLAREPSAADAARAVLASKRLVLERRLAQLAVGFADRVRAELDLLPAGAAIAPHALSAASSFVATLR